MLSLPENKPDDNTTATNNRFYRATSASTVHQSRQGALTAQITATHFNTRFDNQPKERTYTRAELSELLTNHAIRKVKDKDLISFVVYAPGETRKNENALFITAAVLEFDGTANTEYLHGVLGDLDHIIYSTYNHAENDPRYRVVVFLAYPIPAQAWPGVWRQLNALFEDKSDPACKDAARMHYLPACPIERKELRYAADHPGQPLDILELPPIVEPEPDAPLPAPQPGPRPTYHERDARRAYGWVQGAIKSEALKMVQAEEGHRHNQRLRSATALGGFIHTGFTTGEEITTALSVNFGSSQRSALQTIRDGLIYGMQKPRTIDLPPDPTPAKPLPATTTAAPTSEPTRTTAPAPELTPEPPKAATPTQLTAPTPADIRRTFRERAREISEPRTLDDVISIFRKWLYLEDSRLIEVYFGTIAANLLDGDPVWLMLVGASGGGKTEPLNAAGRLPFIHLAATVTESSLLSGTPKKEKAKAAKGGLLREVGPFGILLLKDFTSMLARRRDESAAVLSAFREIYDGSWTRHVGSDGGTTLHWSGKLALVAGCTDTIDSHHAVIGTMGERFAFYRLPEVDQRKLSRHALKIGGRESQMRAELAKAVAGLFAGVELPDELPELPDTDFERLIDLAQLTARCRSAVERDSYSREITLKLSPEAPTRIAKILRQLLHGMEAIGVPRDRAWQALQKIALDSMHKIRRAALGTLADGEIKNTSQIAAAIGYPTQTTRRALEELHAHKVLFCHKEGQGKTDRWQLSEWTIKTCRAIIEAEKPTFPVFQTNDISSLFIERKEAGEKASNEAAIYIDPEKRESPSEASETDAQEVSYGQD